MSRAFAPRRKVTCSICKETGHNMRTCPFGYADHFEPVECQLVNTRQYEPCYRFDPICFLNEPLVAELLPVDTVECILLDTTNLDLLADTASKASKLLPIKKRVMFSDKAPQICVFYAPLSENKSPAKLPFRFGEDEDDAEDLKIKALSLLNKQINTLCPKVNDHALRRSVKAMPKSMVAIEQKKNFKCRIDPIKFVMGELLTSTTVMEDLKLFPKDVLEKSRALIQGIIVELNEGREVYPLYESGSKIKKPHIELLENRSRIIELYLKTLK
jgi:hypothetical protein